MEKEMKKLLLVAVSVGVFLLVTITVAIILISPKVQSQETAYSSSVPYSHNRVQPAQDIVTSMPAQPETVTFNNTTNEIQDFAEVDISNGDSLVIQIPMPTSTAIPDIDTSANGRQQVVIAPAPVVPVRQTPAAESTTAARPTAQPQNTAATTPAARQTTTNTRPAAPATTTRAINDFWVQTGAFSSMVRAEDAKEALASKGLTSIIETRIVNGQTFYRVRLGPYTSQNEANHWLEIVKIIDGFGESQVRQTTRQ